MKKVVCKIENKKKYFIEYIEKLDEFNNNEDGFILVENENYFFVKKKELKNYVNVRSKEVACFVKANDENWKNELGFVFIFNNMKYISTKAFILCLIRNKNIDDKEKIVNLMLQNDVEWSKDELETYNKILEFYKNTKENNSFCNCLKNNIRQPFFNSNTLGIMKYVCEKYFKAINYLPKNSQSQISEIKTYIKKYSKVNENEYFLISKENIVFKLKTKSQNVSRLLNKYVCIKYITLNFSKIVKDIKVLKRF